MTSFLLGFDRVTCTRCGDPERIVGTPCATCGQSPRLNEINNQVQRRRLLVQRVRPSLQAPFDAPPTAGQLFRTYHELFIDVCRNLHEIVEAAAHASQPDTDAAAEDSFARALSKVSRNRARLDAYRPLRPFATRLQMLRSIHDQTNLMASKYLDAFEASIPLDAQRLANEAQRHIDSAAKSLDRMNTYQDAAEYLEQSHEQNEILFGIVDMLQFLNPGASIFEFDSVGSTKVQNLAGSTPSAGVGTSFLALEAISEVHFQPERLADLVKAAYELCAEHPQSLSQLASSPRVRDVLRNSRKWNIEAYSRLVGFMRPDLSDDDFLRHIINLYASLFEDTTMPTWAMLLTISEAATKPYDRLIQEDASELIRRMRARPELSAYLEGTEKGYRHAGNHSHQYHVNGDDAVFELKSFSERIPIAEVFDACLAMIESISAVQIVLDDQFTKLGYLDHQVGDLGPFQPTNERLAEVLLAAKGIVARDIDFSGDSWRVTVSGRQTSRLEVAAGIATLSQNGVREICVQHETRSPAGVAICFSPIMIREFLESQDDAIIRTIRLLAELRTANTPYLNTDGLRSALGAICVRALSNSELPLIRLIRRLRKIAVELEDLEAAQRADQAIRALRSTASPDPQLMARFAGWIDRSMNVAP